MTFVSDGVESRDKTFASLPCVKGVTTDDVALAFAFAREEPNFEAAIAINITSGSMHYCTEPSS